MLTAAWSRMMRVPDALRTSFWFLPSMMATLAVVLSFIALRLDRYVDDETVAKLSWLYAFGPEGARAVLSTVASSMITVAGLTFSITMLTIQLASSQFGPRLLRNLMRDRSTQAVLGIFVSTFIYCLLVLRTIRGVEGAGSVPHLSVALGVFLALASLGMLIFFIHHIALSLRLETVLAQLTREAKASIDLLYPETEAHSSITDGHPQARLADMEMAGAGLPVDSHESGYIQDIDLDALLDLASRNDISMKVHSRPGDFVVAGDLLLTIWPADRCSPEISHPVAQCFVIGDERTPNQDLGHSSGRIVEIAQRALSSGINDPVTALYCVDRLRQILIRLVERPFPSPVLLDDSGQPRLWSAPHDADAFAARTLSDVLRYGTSEPALLAKIMAIAQEIRSRLGNEETPILASLLDTVQNCSAGLALDFDRRNWNAMREHESAGEESGSVKG